MGHTVAIRAKRNQIGRGINWLAVLFCDGPDVVHFDEAVCEFPPIKVVKLESARSAEESMDFQRSCPIFVVAFVN